MTLKEYIDPFTGEPVKQGKYERLFRGRQGTAAYSRRANHRLSWWC